MKKNRNSKKDMKKFSSRNARSSTDRRARKRRAQKELQRLIEATGVDSGRARIKLSYDEGFSARSEKSFSSSGKRRNITATGKYSETASGFGFVNIGEGERDIFIPEGASLDALDGDTVEIVYNKFTSRTGEEKTEGRVTRVTEAAREEIIGVVHAELLKRGKARLRRFYVTADDSRIHRKFYIVGNDGFQDGDKVLAKIKRGRGAYFECYILDNFGEGLTKEANYRAILAECGIEEEFSEAELQLADAASKRPLSYEGRVIRDEVIFTIDSESAKDLDDAISIKALPEGKWLLGVHIADVSEYVEEKTALDRLVMRRGTSVYFTDKVVPMLPKSLSNGACSLHPGEPKYTLSAMITLSAEGDIEGLAIEPSVINSRVKGIYSEINQIFTNSASPEILEKYKDCIPSLRLMHRLYGILAEKSVKRGALNLDSAEAYVVLDGDGYPCDIIKTERGDAERMIEQFMLCANEAVATYLSERGIPCVFRVHDAPPEDKLEDFINYAHNLGFDTSIISRANADSRSLGRLLDEARERGISEAVSYTLLRSMAKAEYSDKRSSHFGLGIEKYCHFTSPIRRLSDLATHRIIHRALIDGKEPKRYASYAARAATAATEGEIRAVNAERRIENLYKTIYMSDRIGEVYPAVINSITSFGIFATLENTCEGLIPISELDGMYVYDEKALTISSREGSYHIGDRITIRVEEADIQRGKLRFSVIKESEETV